MGVSWATKTALAVVLALSLLFAGLLAASPSLHQWWHGDDATADSQVCAACLIAHGLTDSLPTQLAAMAVAFCLLFFLRPPHPVLWRQVDFRAPPDRGPPLPA